MMQNDQVHFSTTQWSVVIAAAHGDSERSRAAMQELCARYWRPVQLYVCRKGINEQDAEDTTQSFFHFVVSEQLIGKANPAKGRFRSFLLTALTNFLHNERDRKLTLKRGGKVDFVSTDELDSNEGDLVAIGSLPEEQYFDRLWAVAVVTRVLGELREEYQKRGKGTLCEKLERFLTGEPHSADYDALGESLGMESSAVKVALHRARRRFGELLRSEVAQTVQQPEDVEDEIRHLLRGIAK